MIKRIVSTFLEGHLAVLLGVAALLLGLASVFLTPREEEPQIVVPVADVFVEVPGASAAVLSWEGGLSWLEVVKGIHGEIP